MACVKVIFWIKMYWTKAKMMLLADVVYSFANAVEPTHIIYGILFVLVGYWPSNIYMYIYIYINIHTYINTYMFVVNFDALAQASDIRIERRQVVILCWMQDSNPRSQTPIRQQTECMLTNRLSYRGPSYKTWTRQPVPMISKHSAHSTSLPVGFRTWLWRYTCLLLLISMLWHRQAVFESKGDKLSSSAECTYIHT